MNMAGTELRQHLLAVLRLHEEGALSIQAGTFTPPAVAERTMTAALDAFRRATVGDVPDAKPSPLDDTRVFRALGGVRGV